MRVMVKSNFEIDVKVNCIENGTTQTQIAKIAKDIHTSKEYVNKVTKKQEGIVNRTYVHIIEALGYDIELVYVKQTEA